MGVESKRIRDWLASATFTSVTSHRVEPDTTAEPPTYIASFNPFPALVIGVTGAAMAAHAQTYLFQVSLFCYLLPSLVNRFFCEQGSDPSTLGKPACRLFSATVFHVLLFMAWSATVNPTFTSTNGSPWQFIFGVRRFGIYVIHRGSHNCCHASWSRRCVNDLLLI